MQCNKLTLNILQQCSVQKACIYIHHNTILIDLYTLFSDHILAHPACIATCQFRIEPLWAYCPIEKQLASDGR